MALRGVVLEDVIRTRDRTMRFVTINHLAVNTITPLTGTSVNFLDKIDLAPASELTVGDFASGADPTGIANTWTLYAIDNGSDKTRLMVVFGDDVPQQLAIEP